jgi:hypothetical protein
MANAMLDARQEGDGYRRIEVITGQIRRRRWTRDLDRHEAGHLAVRPAQTRLRVSPKPVKQPALGARTAPSRASSAPLLEAGANISEVARRIAI